MQRPDLTIENATAGQWHCWACAAPSPPTFDIKPENMDPRVSFEVAVELLVDAKRREGITGRFFINVDDRHLLLVLPSMSSRDAAYTYHVMRSPDTPVCPTVQGTEYDTLAAAYWYYHRIHAPGFILLCNNRRVPVTRATTQQQVGEYYDYVGCRGPSHILSAEEEEVNTL